ncbi:putative reverse transcriptase domain-containing protein [Tanacetum coccineum]|uniref:Reverse transcriptase domain-containing protein n=1 Tax=Tanacetum coccineum TaxID=301880 RepID=A0ABQ4Y373_9ASTR
MILAAQSEAFKEENVLAKRLHGLDQQMERKEDKSLYFIDRIWVPLVGGVRTIIMDEVHKTRYSVHPGADKMYHDLRDMYWPSGLLQQPEMPEWKWDNITTDFITTLPRTNSGHDTIWVVVDRLTKSSHFVAIREDYSMEQLARLYIDKIVARHGVLVSIILDRDGQFTSRFCYHSSIRCAPFKALYGRKYRSPVLWSEIGESRLIRPELVQEMTDKVVFIKEKLKVGRDRQKSYAYNRRKPTRVDTEKCLADANLHVPLDEIKIDKTFCFVEEPVEIIDREVKSLKRSRILIVKVCWNSKCGPEFTWEREAHMKVKYP